MTECSLETSVLDWGIDHPDTLAVFQEWGIDYSCGGKSWEFAWREQGIEAVNDSSFLLTIVRPEASQQT